MSNPPKIPAYKGRNIGIVVLTAAQLLIGSIHVFFGVLLLAFENLAFMQATVVYDVYTVVFGVLTLVFAFYIWRLQKTGWVGTIAILLFVIVVDSLTLLGLPSIPGIPMSAAFGEIGYSLVVIFYLLQSGVRRRFKV